MRKRGRIERILGLLAIGLFVVVAVAVVARPALIAAWFGVTVSEQPRQEGQAPVPTAVCDSVPILMYHSISFHPVNNLQITPAVFEAQMQYLRDAGFHTITFEDLAQWEAGKPIPTNPVLVTFDDGYQDNYTLAFPIWKRYGIRVTVFVISGRVDTPRHLNWSEIAQMRLSGLVEVGAHTETHRDLTILPPAEQVEEIAGSKQAIEANTGQRVVAFDYPAGRYNAAAVADVAAAGYEFAVTTDPGYARRTQNPLLLSRVRVSGGEPLKAFETALAPDLAPASGQQAHASHNHWNGSLSAAALEPLAAALSADSMQNQSQPQDSGLFACRRGNI